MDIALDAGTLRRRRLHSWGRSLLVVLAFIALLVLLRHWLAPAVERSAIRTAIVERGPISTEVQAVGLVVPMYERVLISPVSSSIREIHLPLGSTVKAGDPILKLDSTQIELDIRRLKDQLRLKELEIAGLVQQQHQQLSALRNQEELARLDLENQTVTLERYETLRRSNIASQNDYDLASLSVKKSGVLVRQLVQQISDTLASNRNLVEQRDIESQLLRQQLNEQEQLLSDTTVRASTAGMITVLSSQLGQNVVAGAELVRISDLSSFRVDATLSDFYLHQVSVGMPVNIDIGTGDISGTLSQILPAVDNGTIRLQIELTHAGHVQLKPSMRVEAKILTQQRDSGMRVSNGIVFNSAGLQQVFVIQGNTASKRQVEVGLQNSNFVEIVSGLVEGEEIIISDMSDYDHLEQVVVTD
ncbi:MAG: efflux RND transporter periplasmic adaptor subunit [Gammaproteobacteria bacterium]|nr:efflux RND transporter periplasmic adaptor subunit [Gammaproteobacteria bacterium]